MLDDLKAKDTGESIDLQEGSSPDLLWSDITPVTALFLSAVCSVLWESGVTFSADHLITLVLSSESSKGWLDFCTIIMTSSESKNQMKSGLFLDVIVGESSSIL